MPDLSYQTPAGAVRGDPPQIGGIREGVVLREEGDEVLVSGATFYGWVRKEEAVIESE